MPAPDSRNNQPLGASIGEIIDRTTTLVHEEIELAKAEIAVSLKNLLRGSVAGILGGTFAFFGLFILLIGLSFFLNDLFWDQYVWLGFFVVAALLFTFGALAAIFALKKIRKGSQLAPEMAISEAKKTQAALKSESDKPAKDEPIQQLDAIAYEEPVVETDVTGPPLAGPGTPASTVTDDGGKNATEKI